MAVTTYRPLPADIRAIQDEMEAIAASYGLDFFPTIFEFLNYEELSMFAAYGGFPSRYPHWRFGAEFDELMKGYSYGLQKIYEMVINTDPCYAYLLSCNSTTDQKLVIAHVYGHCDFFKNNAFFAHTNRKMLDQMANHAARVNRYIDRHGYEVVEQFIDACLSLEDLIDPHSVAVRRRPVERSPESFEGDEAASDGKFRSKDYMDPYINPPDVLKAEEDAKKAEAATRAAVRQFPEQPQRDVLLFLLEHAPLRPWQYDVLSIIRDEAYYFAPQGQTKIMNEGWACVAAETPVFTDRGLIPMSEVVEGEMIGVSDGTAQQQVYDSHIIRDHDVLTVRTRRGLTLTGSTNHRLLCDDGDTWRRLDEMNIEDRVQLSGQHEIWPTELVELSWTTPERVTLHDVAESAGVSLWTVLRHRKGQTTRSDNAIAAALVNYESEENQAVSQVQSKRREIRIPTHVDVDLAEFCGYLVGDGHISKRKRQLGLTTGDADSATHFRSLAIRLFDVRVTVKQDGNRDRVLVSSEQLSDFLTEAIGLTSGPSASEKTIPEVILRSPKPVVAGFLRTYFDSDAYAGPQGVILSTKSERLSAQVQLVLMNFGILSRRREQTDGCWHVHITGASATRFAEEIGFHLTRKQDRLLTYLNDRQWFHAERWDDEIVSIERARADVYDISVTETHRYAAAGFINHNSFWHSTIMTKHGLTDAEVVDYADHHSGTMAMSPTRLNPYKIGIELFRDIEERWDKGQFGSEWDDCDDRETRRTWDKQLGLGRDKIFEVRRVHNDVTFIDTFLNEDFCRRHKLFSFAYNDRTGDYEIASREFQAIKQQLLTSLTNHGRPFIYVEDGNYKNRGELFLKHDFAGIELKTDEARATLENLHKLWTRPVHIETVVDDMRTTLGFDGSEHSVTVW